MGHGPGCDEYPPCCSGYCYGFQSQDPSLACPFFMGCWAGLQGIERGVCLKFLVSFLGGAPDVFGFF